MLKPSRGPELDRERCVEMAGGNQFNLVLMAAARSRELIQQGNGIDTNNAPLTALKEIEAGRFKD